MKVAVIGSGAREHAAALKLSQSPEVDEVHVLPGNAGTESFAYNFPIGVNDLEGALQHVMRNGVDATFVGPESPLGEGIVDLFREHKQPIFGPTKAQARVEVSKAFAKQLAVESRVPTAGFQRFGSKDQAIGYMQDCLFPLVVKSDKDASGKGVRVCHSIEEAGGFIEDLESGRLFGQADQEIVVEEFVEGPEMSLHSISDGKAYKMFPFAVRDHKQLYANDEGPMTGGMGVVGPLMNYSPQEVEELGYQYVAPVIYETEFSGLLFPGLKGLKGRERLLEWNGRGGDPELQVYLRLMQSDLLPLMMGSIEGNLDNVPDPTWHAGKYAVNIVLATEGYPLNPRGGAIIDGLSDAAKVPGVQILHANTVRKPNDDIAAGPNGGRSLNIVAVADSLEGALKQANTARGYVYFDGKRPVRRSDIGYTALQGI